MPQPAATSRPKNAAGEIEHAATPAREVAPASSTPETPTGVASRAESVSLGEQSGHGLDAGSATGGPRRAGGRRRRGKKGQQAGRQSLFDRCEAFVSRLSTRNNFWHRVCSLIWLPYAFRSGIRMKRLRKDTFTAVLPFKRFNRNWYNAMAGAALLANSEIAGGMYIFGICGGDYTVVCKRLEYKFLRPCFGPAVYKILPREPIEALVAAGGEFNATIDIDISQQLTKPGTREKRVGKCEATFHITPKVHHKNRRERRAVSAREESLAAATPESGDQGEGHAQRDAADVAGNR